MKACVVQEFSGPSGLAYVDAPEPQEFDGSVLIEVKAAGVCFPDLLQTKGEYQLKLPLPFIPGMETAGVVISAPADSPFAPGDRVCGFGMMGGYAERIALPVSSVVASPPSLNDAEAVVLLVNYFTMQFALERRAALRPGETVLVLGSAGGIGTAAIQIAKAMGATVIAVVHREGATEFVQSLGPDVVLPMTDGWAAAVREATGGRGVDVVVDPVGGAAFDDAVRTLASEGRLLVIGFAAGAIPTVKVNRLLLRNAGVLGVAWAEFLFKNPDAQADVAAGVAKLVDGGLKPPPPQRYPLSEGRAALEALGSSGVLGKVVLEPD